MTVRKKLYCVLVQQHTDYQSSIDWASKPRTGRHGCINMYADDTTVYTEAETAEQALEALGLDAQSMLDW